MSNFVGKLTSDGFWLGLVFLALVVGALSVLPAFLIGRDLGHRGGEFLLMQQSVYRDEFFQYMPRAREVFDGRFPPAGVYANETGPSPLNPLPPLVFSWFLHLFGGYVNGAYLAAQFFFTSLIFLLLFALGVVLFRSRALALFFSLVGVLTQIPQLLFRYYDRDYWSILFKKFIPIIRTPLDKMYFARMDDPMLTFPVLLAALMAFSLFWIKPTKYRAAWAGLFSGLLAYVYLHYWLFMTVFIGVMFLLTLGLKNQRVNLKQYFILGAAFFLILTPYFVNYFDFNSLNSAADYAFRLGKETDRFLVWEYLKSPSGFSIMINQIVYLVFLLLVYFLYLRTNDNDRKSKGIFFLGLILAMFLVWHIPMLSGFGFALTHFNKPINLAVFIILFDAGYVAFKNIVSPIPTLKNAVVLAVVVLAVSLLAKHVVNAAAFSPPPPDQLKSYNFPKELTFSWQWISSNVAGEPKIVSDSLVTSLYLASYTSSRPYLATGFISALSNFELENRFYVSNKLFQVPTEIIGQRFNGSFSYDCSVSTCFKDAGLNMDFGKTRWYLISAAWSQTSFAKEPERTLKKYEGMSTGWHQTGSDFVYYGPWEKQFSLVDLSKDDELGLVYKDPRVEIFKIINNDIL